MSNCFWTGYVNTEEPGCGGDAPPALGSLWVAIMTFGGSEGESFSASDLFNVSEGSVPSLPELFSCVSMPDPVAVDLLGAGYDEVRVGATWYTAVDLVPTPSLSGVSPATSGNFCAESCNGLAYRASEVQTIRFRSSVFPELPEIDVQYRHLENTCF